MERGEITTGPQRFGTALIDVGQDRSEVTFDEPFSGEYEVALTAEPGVEVEAVDVGQSSFSVALKDAPQGGSPDRVVVRWVAAASLPDSRGPLPLGLEE